MLRTGLQLNYGGLRFARMQRRSIGFTCMQRRSMGFARMQRRSMGFAWRLYRDGAAYLPWPAGLAVIVLAAAERALQWSLT